MRFETKEYQVWYTDGPGTRVMRVRATSTYEALEKAENILNEHEEVLGVKEMAHLILY